MSEQEQLIHDVSWAVSQHVLEVFAGVLREEQHPDAFAEILLRVKAGLECYEIQAARRVSRCRPGKN
jgi:hypothetical protein